MMMMMMTTRMRLLGYVTWRGRVLLLLLLMALAAGVAETSGNRLDEACQDFYLYSCRDWERSNSIPENEDFYNRISEVTQAINQRLREDLSSDTSTDPVSRKLATLYQSCSDTNKTDELRSLKQLVQQLGLWPRRRRLALETLLPELDALDMNPILNVRIQGQKIIIERKYLALEPALLKKLEKGEQSRVRATYTTALLKMVRAILQVDLTATLIQQQMNFAVELDLVKEGETRPTMKSLRFSNLTQQFTQISWSTLLNGLLKGTGHTVNDNTEVDVDTEFLKSFLTLTKTHGKPIVENYLMLHTLQSCVRFLGQNIRDIFQPVTEALQTRLKKIDPPKCLDFATSYMSNVLTKSYVDKYFPQETTNEVREMVNLTLKAVKSLHKTDAKWMKYIRQRVDELSVEVRYPEVYNTEGYMQKYYKDLRFVEGNFLENVFAFRRWRKNTLSSLPDEPTINSIHPFNRHYPFDTSVRISTFYMMPPYYSASWPMSQKFGGIGSVIGNYVSQLLDKSALPQNASQRWSDCLKNQYNRLEVQINSTSFFVNGTNTLPDNMDDNLGLLLAIKAYRLWARRNRQEITRTEKQRCFVAYAQTLCQLMTEAEEKNEMEMGYSTPNKFRASVPPGNLLDFASAFRCRNRPDLCRL